MEVIKARHLDLLLHLLKEVVHHRHQDQDQHQDLFVMIRWKDGLTSMEVHTHVSGTAAMVDVSSMVTDLRTSVLRLTNAAAVVEVV